MEWWRAKWNPMVQKLTQWFEKVAVEKSHAIVSDNMGIKDYVREHFNRDSYFIAYAADLLPAPDESVLNEFGLEKFQYHAMIGRLEPENNIEMILDGIRMSSSPSVTHIFANNQTKYGHYLMKKYSDCSKIKFMGWVSGQERLNNIRHYAKYYLHGHSVGGTNPSLLEAMAGGAFLVAHGNVFNKYVLGNEALYFTSPEEVKNIIDNYETHRVNRDMFIRNNIEKINKHYNWDVITDNYEKMFFEIVHSKN
jgi:glycosyltransferase involved in cell wall biosynthesis